MERVSKLPPLPPRPADGHKGLFGRVLVVGGNDTMVGAPAMAGRAALRSGAGLVQVAVPKSILPAVLSLTPELIGLSLRRATAGDKLLEAAEKADAVVIGPGLGQSDAAVERVHRLIRLRRPMVVDADALNILAAGVEWPAQFKAHAVLTPHPGEMARLAKFIGKTEVPSDPDGRIAIARQTAAFLAQIIVLKGKGTVVTDGTRVYVNPTGDSSLSKAGTGDVLTGVIAALLGQGMERFQAACAGTWIHGRAGEIAGQRLGQRCVLASDVIETLPQAFAAYEQLRDAQAT